MNQYYMNLLTGEITESHREAVEWYRTGINVAVYKNGIKRLEWFH